ncbi:hypothetical protein F2P56_030701 [Juglans regia]|uniref:Uncharacterized protein n=2 Tax=Juglans regia TaxID=51240 RepID=A0A833WZN2_JUGRE|nr:proline-rich receptor-like protein kinase PERK2 [Juglans regia]KAF5450341.1 hypothetical protein F2P56_030701 [Juglans regia]
MGSPTALNSPTAPNSPTVPSPPPTTSSPTALGSPNASSPPPATGSPTESSPPSVTGSPTASGSPIAPRSPPATGSPTTLNSPNTLSSSTVSSPPPMTNSPIPPCPPPKMGFALLGALLYSGLSLTAHHGRHSACHLAAGSPELHGLSSPRGSSTRDLNYLGLNCTWLYHLEISSTRDPSDQVKYPRASKAKSLDSPRHKG